MRLRARGAGREAQTGLSDTVLLLHHDPTAFRRSLERDRLRGVRRRDETNISGDDGHTEATRSTTATG